MSFTQKTEDGRLVRTCDGCGETHTSLWDPVLAAWARAHVCFTATSQFRTRDAAQFHIRPGVSR